MEALTIVATDNTPKIVFDHVNSSFEISGESRPEDVRKFYKPVLQWLDNYNSYLYWLAENYPKAEKKKVFFNFKFDYFNSSSAKYIMDIMHKLNEIQNNCKNVSIDINWYHETLDEDMMEAGEEFRNITNLPFKFLVMK